MMEIIADPNYFDYAASAPVWREALEAYTKISEDIFANPSSIHRHGKEAKQKLLELKKELCDLMQFHDGRFLLCSSGSEANNTIIEGHMKRFPKGKLLIAEDVHSSIWYTVKKNSKVVRILSIDQNGNYKEEDFHRAISDKVTLICLSHVCNEVGTIHKVKELAELSYQNEIKLLIDGVQAVGHLPVNLNEIPCNYYTISGHKFGAVKGAGGGFIRDNEFEAFIHGGKQEWELRAGTENLAGLVSMVAALKKSLEILEKEAERLQNLKDIMIDQLKNIPRLLINSPVNSLPGYLSISFPGMSGREIVGALSLSGFAVSTGSACHANEMEPSRIILAMGRSKEEAIGSIRISMGIGTTYESVQYLIEKLKELVD